MSNTNQWIECLKLIKEDITGQAYQTWFSPISCINITDDEITLEVPNRFHYEWLDSKYNKHIESALNNVFGKALVVKYSVIINTEKENVAQPATVSNKVKDLIPKPYHSKSQLNRRYTFKNFIEGRGNQFAKAAASSVADAPGQTPFNPLLIYSSPGLGKTHLIQAIGNHILHTNPKTKVVYVTSEKFMLDFIFAIQNNKSTKFAQSYRNIDVLLIDDIQFFQTKEQTQEQFFHLFNDLFQQGKQIVLSTDRHPNELTQLKQRLVSRFQSGLIVDIQPPDLETRIAILMNKAKRENLDIPYEVTEYIASSIKEDIRTMEGALVRLLALASLKNEDITIGLAKDIIEEILGQEALEQISLERVCQVVSKQFKIDEKKLYAKTRQMEIVNARQIAMYLSRELTKSSLMSIGSFFGKRDHSTVIHACKTIEEKLNSDKNMSTMISQIKNTIIN